MSRRFDLSRPVPRHRPMPDGLTDAQWWTDAESRYEEYWREFTGSPESISAGAQWFYMSGEFGAAALMYQKAIDLLHTLYCCNDLPVIRDIAGARQPCADDLPITDGYCSSLGATLSLHPGAPVTDSITEVAARLQEIFFTCKRAGISPGLYGHALLDLEPAARRYGIPIDRSAFAEPKAMVINNRGIMASDNAIVSGNVLASGQGAYAAATAMPLASPDQITALLRQFIGELARSGHADRVELAATAEEACQELAGPAPRRARLKILASGLAAAVKGTGLMAALAVQIEQAMHGL
jgi:hypothetical protein